MNNELINTLGSVIGVLNNIEVKGKQNLANLHGAISILEDLGNRLIREEDENQPKTERTSEEK